MKTLRVASSAFTLWLVIPWGASSQARERTPQAAVQDLELDGRASDYHLFVFQGCPQADPVGRAVFDAIQQVELDGEGIESLSGPLAYGVYPICGYEPLTQWMAQAFRTLHAGNEVSAADRFVRGLGPIIEEELQAAILDAASDESFGSIRGREALVHAALQRRPREAWLNEGIAALSRSIPRQAKSDLTYRLSREFGAAFFGQLAVAAPRLENEALFTVVRAIASDIQDGRVQPDASGLDELRTQLEARSNRPSGVVLPTQRQAPIPLRAR